jgi:hypothetical protein
MVWTRLNKTIVHLFLSSNLLAKISSLRKYISIPCFLSDLFYGFFKYEETVWNFQADVSNHIPRIAQTTYVALILRSISFRDNWTHHGFHDLSTSVTVLLSSFQFEVLFL